MLAVVVRLALGDQHSMILKQDGSVWSAGYNEYGQLGVGSAFDSFDFVSVKEHFSPNRRCEVRAA